MYKILAAVNNMIIMFNGKTYCKFTLVNTISNANAYVKERDNQRISVKK